MKNYEQSFIVQLFPTAHYTLPLEMKQRTKDYLNRKKARAVMLHPTDLKSFLVAEYESSRNLVVKKDVLKMINELDASSGANESSVRTND